MKPSSGILVAALLALPATGWSQEEEVRPAKPVAEPVSFDPREPTVREILRTTALERSTAEPATGPHEAARAETAAARIAQTLALKFRSDRRIDHLECDALQCYAYSRDGEVLFATPRDPSFGALSDLPKSDAALACLDTNDLLTTFERIDRCRGIGVGLPPQWNGGWFNVRAPGRDGPRDPP